MQELDIYDKKLLKLLQEGLPLTARPYLTVAQTLGLTEEEVIDRIGRMKQQKVIRRFSGFFNSSELGYKTVLCGALVKEEDVDGFARLLEGYRGVTHNYIRDNDRLNLWFTLISPDQETEDRIVGEIEDSGLTGKVYRFYKKRLFKIHASFQV